MPVTNGLKRQAAPLSDAVITAVARLVDDAQSGTREPSHSDIEFHIHRGDLGSGDPRSLGQNVGKAKRVRATLSWAIEHKQVEGERLVADLISLIRASGGFRETSPNFVGHESVTNAQDAFRHEGYELSNDGELRPLFLDNLSGEALSEALQVYVRRAKRGTDDAALVTGTSKDLLEATAAHILNERFVSYASSSNFPTLLGQTFVCLGLATPQHPPSQGEPPQRDVERATYSMACAINRLRNKEGTGHGRPWLPSVTDAEAKQAIELMGVIAERLLAAHQESP